MKKLLLTLGTVAAAVAPITAVVACTASEDALWNAGTATVEGETLSITGIKGPKLTEDMTDEERSKLLIDSVEDVASKMESVSNKDKITIIKLEWEEFDLDLDKYESFDNQTDLANVDDFANLQELWDDYSGRTGIDGGASGGAELISTLMDPNSEDIIIAAPVEGEVDTTTVTDALDALIVNSTLTKTQADMGSDAETPAEAIANYKLDVTVEDFEAVLTAGGALEGVWGYDGFSAFEAEEGITVKFYHESAPGVQETHELKVTWADEE